MKLAWPAPIVGAVLVALALTGCQALLDPRSTMTVDDVLDAFSHQPDLPVTNPSDITAEACGDEERCQAAVRADELAIYQFSDREDAEAFTSKLGDNGYQSDWIVLEYPGAK